MSTTKYIINSGTQSISGSLEVQGTLKSNSTGVYRALLTQTGQIVGNNLQDFNYGLIIGETYSITSYVTGDDFSNIADVVSGTINATNSVFIATGQIPANYSNSSELTSGGGLIVDVLENTLGYDLIWIQTPLGGDGYYIAVNSNTGPIYNSFQRDKVEIITPFKYPFYNGGPSFPPFIVPSIISFINKDSFISIDVYDFMGGQSNDLLYYTPIEIKINQDPLTPVIVYGLNVSSFPYGNISIDVIAGENYVQTFYGDYVLVNNINELVIALNNDTTINYLGAFSVNEGVENGIILTTTERIKNQFSPNNTLTFEAFND